MANVDNPNGLRPVKTRGNSGSAPIGWYWANVTTAIFEGDVVEMDTDGTLVTITAAAGSIAVRGVAAAYNAASTSPKVKIPVYDDKDTIFEIQADDDADPATLATNEALQGGHCDLVINTGSTTTGQSIHELDHSDAIADSSDIDAPLKIIDLVSRAGVDNSLMHSRWLVKLNRHIENTDVTGISA